MPRLIPLILVLSGCLGLASCGNKPEQLQLPTEEPTVTQPETPE